MANISFTSASYIVAPKGHTVGLVIYAVIFVAVSLSDVLRQLFVVYIFAVGGVRLCVNDGA